MTADDRSGVGCEATKRACVPLAGLIRLAVLSSLMFLGCNRSSEPSPNDPSAVAGGNAPAGVRPLAVPPTDVAADGIGGAALERLGRQAESLVAAGRYADAAAVAIEISASGVPDPVAPLMQAFDWHLRAGDLGAAENDLRRALESSPEDARVHRALAQLLNSEGRRFESREHVLGLIRSGAVAPRELLSLIDLGGPFQLVSFAEVVGDTPGTLFDLGKARQQFIAEEKPKLAMETLDKLAAKVRHPAVEALRGRILAEEADQEGLSNWLKDLPEGIEEQPEYWLAIGLWLNHRGRDEEAVGALSESLRRDPTDRRSLRALSAALGRLGENEKARQAQATLAILDSIFRNASSADASKAMSIAEQLQQLQRHWESVAWYRYAFQLGGVLEQRADELNGRVSQIRQWETNTGQERIASLRLKQMIGFDSGEFPMPEVASLGDPIATEGTESPADSNERKSTALRFTEVAQSLGVKTTFVSEYPLEAVDFYLYQANGGGLATFDYDLDGRCDLYVVQSGGDPNQAGSSVANQLYRQLSDSQFQEVTDETDCDDRGYGQGVCVADINQDGLPDLLVANIGRNAVYLNQGDGTFRNRSSLLAGDTGSWTSSLAAGDLDGDQLPDVVEVNYLDDPLIFERKCVGKQLNCTPQRFRAAGDRIYRNTGSVGFQIWSGAESISELPNYGFGAVIANFDDVAGNDVFISNDGDVNHFWRSLTSEESAGHGYRLKESAAISGCSIGTSGISQACMGIASGDFDRNGKLDLLVTNFHNEPVNLFLQAGSGIFVDEALKYGLAQPTKDVLGFGTQAEDFDNDGWLDVAIANGHIYDARYAGIPFRMLSQLFRGTAGGWVLQQHSAAGGYWSREQLGRTMATFDFNRDGKMDLVVNHLDQPVAILRNESDAQQWLQFELVGVESERDAVGAKVVVETDQQQWSGWQTGGDGYMCTNESVIHIGLGPNLLANRIEIHWPSGYKQEIRDLPTNRRYLIVEGEAPHERVH